MPNLFEVTSVSSSTPVASAHDGDRSANRAANPGIAGYQGRPLHLLIVSSTDASTHIHGADRDWANLLNALGPERVRVTWAGVRNSASLARYLDNRLEVRYLDLNFEPFYDLTYQSMYRVRSWRNWAGLIGAHLRSTWGAVKALRLQMRRDRPDVVVTNTSVVLAGSAYAWSQRLPHVWFVKEFLDPTVSACRKYTWLIERMSNAVVVPSEAMSKAFSSHVRILNDGSDLSSIQLSVRTSDRAEVLRGLGLPASQPVVAQIGVICYAKGQQVTARACARLASAGRSPCSVLFLGAGTSQQREELSSMLASTPEAWRSSIRFLEFGPENFSYLAAADIVLHPSTMPDPYPNAVREAMILGKPIVGSRIGGIPELVVDGLTGILVEPDNDEELASALARLLDSPEERAEMGAAGRRLAHEKFDVQLHKQAFYDLLLEMHSAG
jgi:glycosyltransferase involved in cell wall biosynthesis